MIDTKMTSVQKEAFENGYNASYLGGFGKDANPYPVGELHWSWEQGRLLAVQEHPDEF